MQQPETAARAPAAETRHRRGKTAPSFAARVLESMLFRVKGVGNIVLARPPRFVIIGTGRCGTSYAAAYLSDLGIACSHEGYFTPDGPKLRNRRRPADAKGDVSWLAVPFLKGGELPIVHLVRHPQDVVRSLYNMGFFDPRFRDVHRDFIAFAERHFHVGEDPFDACVRWCIEWNERCERLAGLRIQVEAFEKRLPDLTAYIGFAPTRTAPAPSSTWNSWLSLHPRPLSAPDVEQRLLRHPRGGQLAEIAERYGYASEGRA